MYPILISAALAIYSIILVDFSVLYQEISVNNDLLASTQALYTAEGAIENTVGLIGDQEISVANIRFIDESDHTDIYKGQSDFLEYNEGANAFYIQRNLNLDQSSLDSAEGALSHSRATYSGAYLSDGQTLDQKAYYGLEPRKARGFVIREVDVESNFNEIQFDFNQEGEASEILFEIFAFPKEGDVTFQDFETLRKNPESNPIKRVVINTLDTSAHTVSFGSGVPFTVDVRDTSGAYKKSLIISGFNPIQNNYILYFQTLDNQPVHFRLTADYQGQTVVLPNMMQTIDVIGATSTGLYSRIKYQRQSEESIAPGLNFVHFTDQDLIK